MRYLLATMQFWVPIALNCRPLTRSVEKSFVRVCLYCEVQYNGDGLRLTVRVSVKRWP
jgi:hypothetical protein